MTGLQVLVIEDDALIGLLLTSLLEDMGHVVCATATTEAEAIEAARQHQPGLVIADGALRSGDGVRAVAAILRERPVPHFFVSGDPLAIVTRSPQAIVLRKPFRVAALAKAVESSLKAAATRSI